MSGKTSKKMTRGLQLSCGGPLSTVRNQLKVFERTLRRILAFERANSLNQVKFRKPMSGRLRRISMPTRVQEVIIQDGGNDLIPALFMASIHINQQ
jgi:hypothetical protein